MRSWRDRATQPGNARHFRQQTTTPARRQAGYNLRAAHLPTLVPRHQPHRKLPTTSDYDPIDTLHRPQQLFPETPTRPPRRPSHPAGPNPRPAAQRQPPPPQTPRPHRRPQPSTSTRRSYLPRTPIRRQPETTPPGHRPTAAEKLGDAKAGTTRARAERNPGNISKTPKKPRSAPVQIRTPQAGYEAFPQQEPRPRLLGDPEKVLLRRGNAATGWAGVPGKGRQQTTAREGGNRSPDG